MEGYKVLRKQRKTGNLWSGIQTKGRGGRRYKEDEWTLPAEGCGPLGVFGTYREANWFRKTLRIGPGGVSSIWKCDYKPSKQKAFWYIRSGRIQGTTNAAKWAAVIPCGTVFADRVRVTQLCHDSYTQP